MKFRDSAAPIETPTPPVVPTPTANETATTVALIDEVSVAVRLTLSALTSLLKSLCALVLLRMILVDSAPAPLRAMPVAPAIAAEADAAVDSAFMVAASPATREMAPVVVLMSSAFVIAASISLATVLRASATPMDSDCACAPKPAYEAANDAAPAVAVIAEVS